MPVEYVISDDAKKFIANEENQKKVSNLVKRFFDSGKRSRSGREEAWVKSFRAYDGYVNKGAYKKQPWRSKMVMPWSFSAVEAATTELQDLLFPNEYDFFACQPRVGSEEVQVKNAQAMQRTMQYLLEQSKLFTILPFAFKSLCIIGSMAVKVHWVEEYQNGLQPNQDPLTGAVTYESAPILRYKGPKFELVDMLDFVLYPAVGDLDKSLCIHRMYKKLKEVKDNQYYRNRDKVTASTGSRTGKTTGNDYSYHHEVDSAFGIDTTCYEDEDEVVLYEAWGDFYIDGKCFKNYVATCTDTGVLLRFEPNPYPYGLKPFVFTPLRVVPGQCYGMGLIEPGIPYQQLGNTFCNMMADNAKLTMFGQFKYVPDGVFDPDTFVARPGGLHAISDINNLEPLMNPSDINIGLAELQQLESSFREVSGVSKYMIGAAQGEQYRSASEALRLANAGDRIFQRLAKTTNDFFLLPLMRLVYAMTEFYADSEMIQAISGVEYAANPEVIPLPEVSIRITGLQTALLRQQTAEAMERSLTAIGRTPGVNYVDWAEADRVIFEANAVPDVSRLLLPEEIVNVLKQQQVAAALGIPAEAQAESAANQMDEEAQQQLEGEAA